MMCVLQIESCCITSGTCTENLLCHPIQEILKFFLLTIYFGYISQVNAVIIVIALKKICLSKRLQYTEKSDTELKMNVMKAM